VYQKSKKIKGGEERELEVRGLEIRIVGFGAKIRTVPTIQLCPERVFGPNLIVFVKLGPRCARVSNLNYLSSIEKNSVEREWKKRMAYWTS
jgi:hypothetical protein